MALPASSKLTSAPGRRSIAFRNAAGIATCPLLDIRAVPMADLGKAKVKLNAIARRAWEQAAALIDGLDRRRDELLQSAERLIAQAGLETDPPTQH